MQISPDKILSQIARPLKIHQNKEEEEPQGESTHPYPDYPVSQAALEGTVGYFFKFMQKLIFKI